MTVTWLVLKPQVGYLSASYNTWQNWIFSYGTVVKYEQNANFIKLLGGGDA
jgi:hypothetical protein